MSKSDLDHEDQKGTGTTTMIVGVVVLVILVFFGLLYGKKVLMRLGVGRQGVNQMEGQTNQNNNANNVYTPGGANPSEANVNSSDTSNATLDQDINTLGNKMGGLDSDQTAVDNGLNQSEPNIQ